ncbi:MAG: hypothetical protein Q7S79_02790 [bacterium]|nr:hypothetical protein [bacterium]
MIEKLAVVNPLLPGGKPCDTPGGGGSALNPCEGSQSGFTLVELIRNFITLGFIIASLLFVFWFMLGAIKWITSGGDKNKLETARGTVTSAIIGLAVLFSLYMILRLLERFFGINLLQIDLNQIKIR